MKISDENEENIRNFCVDLVSKTFLELGQYRVKEEDIVRIALSLDEDLRLDFPTLELEDIRQAFRNGVRRTEEFLLTPKTYYKWIKTQRDLIWSEDGKEPQYVDKRLRYRSRNGTGMIELKQSKLLKNK